MTDNQKCVTLFYMLENDAVIQQLLVRLDDVSKKVDGFDHRFDELMDFLKEHMAMRSDFGNFMTREDARGMEHRMQISMDQIIKMQQKFDIELLAFKSRTDRLDDKIEHVDGRVVMIEKKFKLV